MIGPWSRKTSRIAEAERPEPAALERALPRGLRRRARAATRRRRSSVALRPASSCRSPASCPRSSAPVTSTSFPSSSLHDEAVLVAERLRPAGALLARCHVPDILPERQTRRACPTRSSTSRASSSSPSRRGTPTPALLRVRDFRTLFVAVSVSELGDALNYIALMWVALEHGGPLGVVAVRLADSLPAFIFGLHGGIAADRWSRRKLMVGADLVRGATLVPRRRARARRVAPALGPRRRGVRARGGDELLRAGLRRDDPGGRRARERAGRERARPGDGAGALDRRLGARGGAARVPAALHVLRGRRRHVLRLGASDPAASGRAAAGRRTASRARLREGIAALRPRRALTAGGDHVRRSR